VLAQTQAAAAADRGTVRALDEQSKATLKSVKKGSGFRVFSELGKTQLAVLTKADFVNRDRFKKAVPEYVDAARSLEELQAKKAAGPPRCFTIGCKEFYENDIWRNDWKDDYTGEGLEKPNGILKPKGWTYEGPP